MNTFSFLRRSGLAAAALVSALPLALAQPKVGETVVGPDGAGGRYIVSQNDTRVAYSGAKGTRTVVSDRWRGRPRGQRGDLPA